MSTTMRWVGLALLGVAIAVGVSIAASSLVSQQIGLASEPITAGDALAPRVERASRPKRPEHTATAKSPAGGKPPPVTTKAQPPATEPQPPATEPEPPAQSSPPGGEGDHGGSADD